MRATASGSTKMARKPRSTSIEGQLIALDAVRAEPRQPPWPLDHQQQLTWNDILLARSRDEWSKIDLRFAAQLAGILVALHDESERLGQEGHVIVGASGPKANPRTKIVA